MSKFKNSVGSCSKNESEFLDCISIGVASAKVITNVWNNEEEGMISANDVHYEAILENEVVLNEIMVCDNNCKRTNEGLNADKLSKT